MKGSVGRQGFTLLEVLVAAALWAILMAAVLGLVGRGMKVWRQRDAQLQRLFATERTMDRLGRELRNGIAAADLPFKGSGEELTFVTATDPLHLTQVQYLLVSREGAGKALVRRWRPFPVDEEGFQTAVLIPKVQMFSVRYGRMDEIDGEKTVRWMGHWNKAGRQPAPLAKLVRVQVDSTTRDFWIPHGILAGSSDE